MLCILPWLIHSDVTDSMVTIRSPFCGYSTICVELNGKDLSCYSNKIESVSLRKCPYNQWLSNKALSDSFWILSKAYLSTRPITVTNISKSFTHKMVAIINWYRYGTKLRLCHHMYCHRSYYMRQGLYGTLLVQSVDRCSSVRRVCCWAPARRRCRSIAAPGARQ